MIVSFAWTSPALVAGRKTVTRRQWDADYAAKFHKGDLVDAYDKSPRFGGKKIATIRLTQDPKLEQLLLMPQSDYEAEGFKYLNEHQDQISTTGWKEFNNFDFAHWDRWRRIGGMMWVVRFELVSVER